MADTNQIGAVRYEWMAPEFARTERAPLWYIVVGVAWLGGMIYTGLTSQWVGLGVVAMVGLVLYLSGRMLPRTFAHQLTDKGVVVAGQFHAYGQLRSFWIAQGGQGPALNLSSAKKLSFLLTLQLGTADIEKVRTVLLEFLPEEAGRGEDVVDKIGRFFKL